MARISWPWRILFIGILLIWFLSCCRLKKFAHQPPPTNVENYGEFKLLPIRDKVAIWVFIGTTAVLMEKDIEKRNNND